MVCAGWSRDSFGCQGLMEAGVGGMGREARKRGCGSVKVDDRQRSRGDSGC